MPGWRLPQAPLGGVLGPLELPHAGPTQTCDFFCRHTPPVTKYAAPSLPLGPQTPPHLQSYPTSLLLCCCEGNGRPAHAPKPACLQWLSRNANLKTSFPLGVAEGVPHSPLNGHGRKSAFWAHPLVQSHFSPPPPLSLNSRKDWWLPEGSRKCDVQSVRQEDISVSCWFSGHWQAGSPCGTEMGFTSGTPSGSHHERPKKDPIYPWQSERKSDHFKPVRSVLYNKGLLTRGKALPELSPLGAGISPTPAPLEMKVKPKQLGKFCDFQASWESYVFKGGTWRELSSSAEPNFSCPLGNATDLQVTSAFPEFLTQTFFHSTVHITEGRSSSTSGGQGRESQQEKRPINSPLPWQYPFQVTSGSLPCLPGSPTQRHQWWSLLFQSACAQGH